MIKFQLGVIVQCSAVQCSAVQNLEISMEEEISGGQGWGVVWDKRHSTRYQRRCFQLFRATPTDCYQWSSEAYGKDLHWQQSVGVARNS